MENLPSYISLVFILTTLLTAWIFFKSSNYSRATIAVLIIWLVLQALISMTGFYTVTDTLPPRFLLLVIPPMIGIILLFATAKGRKYLDSLNAKTLTLLHAIRVPVEIVLWWLFLHKTIPELMTFEGRNFDILAGMSAPLVFYFGYVKLGMNKMAILVWNFICLGLLINIVANAALSAPFPFQQFGFEQPNIAVLYFPFVFLPGCVVPLVLLSHLACIRQLINRGSQ